MVPFQGFASDQLLTERGFRSSEQEKERSDRVLDGLNRGLRTIGLKFQDDPRLERVRNFVSGELDVGEQQELTVDDEGENDEDARLDDTKENRERGSRDPTHDLNMFASVWSSLLIVNVAALGIFPSSSTVTLGRAESAQHLSFHSLSLAKRGREVVVAHFGSPSANTNISYRLGAFIASREQGWETDYKRQRGSRESDQAVPV